MAKSGVVKPHALVVALPLHGHFVPAANIAIKLAARSFTITFATLRSYNSAATKSASNASSLDDGDSVFADAQAEGLDIRYHLLGDSLGPSSDAPLSDRVIEYQMHLLFAHVEELLQKLFLADPPPTVLIADTFSVWPADLAEKYGLPFVTFWTEPALPFAIHHHIDLLIANGHFGSPENRKDAIRYIPGVPAIEPADLTSFFREDASTLFKQLIAKCFEVARRANFVLANTVQELESETIAALQEEARFYPVGPLFHDGFTGGVAMKTRRAERSQWLDSLPPASVLYVSFGSLDLAAVSRRDFVEITYGILSSKANFMWVFRAGGVMSEGDPLPDGFMEAIRGRGMVVPWCDQKKVLLHPAVGGFLTHCGWNSILESMWCGVPMLCFPLISDQPSNRKLVCRDLKIGIDIGAPGEVSRDQVSTVIDSLIGVGGEAVMVRRNAEEVKKALRSAITPSGSSSKNFDKFLLDLQLHVAAKNKPGPGEI